MHAGGDRGGRFLSPSFLPLFLCLVTVDTSLANWSGFTSPPTGEERGGGEEERRGGGEEGWGGHFAQQSEIERYCESQNKQDGKRQTEREKG